MKFKILPKVDGFTDADGVHHKPGDIVDLPAEDYLGVHWLEPVDKPRKEASPPPAKVEEAAAAEKPVPLRRKNAK